MTVGAAPSSKPETSNGFRIDPMLPYDVVGDSKNIRRTVANCYAFSWEKKGQKPGVSTGPRVVSFLSIARDCDQF